jgi:outer membrane protein TolC
VNARTVLLALGLCVLLGFRWSLAAGQAVPAPASTALTPPTVARPGAAVPAAPGATVCRLTLDEAKQRALTNNKLLKVAALNVESKACAVRVAQADYFQKVTATAFYLLFNHEVGRVLSAPGRMLSGPRGGLISDLPGRAIEAPLINQDSAVAYLTAPQLKDFLKIGQQLKIARADQDIAQAELEARTRNLVSGVEQLYRSLLATHRIQAGAVTGLRRAELLAKTDSLKDRIALLEARQALGQANHQLADVQEDLKSLLDLPLGTTLDLVEPPLPVLP